MIKVVLTEGLFGRAVRNGWRVDVKDPVEGMQQLKRYLSTMNKTCEYFRVIETKNGGVVDYGSHVYFARFTGTTKEDVKALRTYFNFTQVD